MVEFSDEVRTIIASCLSDVSPEKIIGSADFAEDLGADSLDMVELVMSFEKEFDIEISDSDAETIKTVDDAINYLKGRLNQ